MNTILQISLCLKATSKSFVFCSVFVYVIGLHAAKYKIQSFNQSIQW